MTKRVLVAARLSVLADGQTGIDSQDIETRRWAEQRGYDVVDVIADWQSGTIQPWKRRNLRQWVGRRVETDDDTFKWDVDPATLDRYDAIAALCFDRLSRGDQESTSEIELWARRYGKELLTVDGLFFPCEGEDGIRWDLAKRLAHSEWLRTSKRYKRAQAWLRENGYLHGRAMYGFKIVPVPGSGRRPEDDHKTLAPDYDEDDSGNPPPAAVVRIAHDLYMSKEGPSLRDICEELDRRGIPSPTWRKKPGHHWIANTLRDIFRNPLIAGRKQQGNSVLRVEGIITLAEFKALNDRLDSRAYRRGVPSKKDKELLISVIYCGVCGSPMYKLTSDGWSRKTVWNADRSAKIVRKYPAKVVNSYYCRSGKGCKMFVAVEEADALFETMAATALARYPAPSKKVTIPGNTHQEEKDQLAADMDALDKTAPDFITRMTTLHAELTRLNELPSEPDRYETTEQSGAEVAAEWARLTTAQKRAKLISLGIRVNATRTPEPERELVLTFA